MVNCFLVCCHHCGRPFHEESRRSCIGQCGHTICLECKTTLPTPKCPICGKENSFPEGVINYQSEGLLKTIRDQLNPDNFLNFSTDSKNFDEGKCSECSEVSKKLRICVNCVKSHNILREGSDNSWKLNLVEKTLDKSFLKAKSLSICATCALDKHTNPGGEKHKVVELRSIAKMSFESSNMLASGALLVQKQSMEDGFGEWQAYVTYFRTSLTRFQVRMALRKKEMLSPFPISAASKPEWEAILKTSKDAVNALHRRNERWMDRMMMFLVENIEEFMECAASKLTTAEDPESFKLLEKVLSELSSIHEKMPVNLTKEQVVEIDKEIEETMSALELHQSCNSLLPDEDETKYFKYKAIISEYEESKLETGKTHNQMLLKVIELQNLMSSYSRPLKGMQQEQEKLEGTEEKNAEWLFKMMSLDTRVYVFLREIFEKQLQVDQACIAYITASARGKMADLMNFRYFPKSPNMTPEDRVYIELLQSYLDKNPRNDSMSVLF